MAALPFEEAQEEHDAVCQASMIDILLSLGFESSIVAKAMVLSSTDSDGNYNRCDVINLALEIASGRSSARGEETSDTPSQEFDAFATAANLRIAMQALDYDDETIELAFKMYGEVNPSTTINDLQASAEGVLAESRSFLPPLSMSKPLATPFTKPVVPTFLRRASIPLVRPEKAREELISEGFSPLEIDPVLKKHSEKELFDLEYDLRRKIVRTCDDFMSKTRIIGHLKYLGASADAVQHIDDFLTKTNPYKSYSRALVIALAEALDHCPRRYLERSTRDHTDPKLYDEAVVEWSPSPEQKFAERTIGRLNVQHAMQIWECSERLVYLGYSTEEISLAVQLFDGNLIHALEQARKLLNSERYAARVVEIEKKLRAGDEAGTDYADLANQNEVMHHAEQAMELKESWDDLGDWDRGDIRKALDKVTHGDDRPALNLDPEGPEFRGLCALASQTGCENIPLLAAYLFTTGWSISCAYRRYKLYHRFPCFRDIAEKGKNALFAQRLRHAIENSLGSIIVHSDAEEEEKEEKTLVSETTLSSASTAHQFTERNLPSECCGADEIRAVSLQFAAFGGVEYIVFGHKGSLFYYDANETEIKYQVLKSHFSAIVSINVTEIDSTSSYIHVLDVHGRLRSFVVSFDPETWTLSSPPGIQTNYYSTIAHGQGAKSYARGHFTVIVGGEENYKDLSFLLFNDKKYPCSPSWCKTPMVVSNEQMYRWGDGLGVVLLGKHPKCTKFEKSICCYLFKDKRAELIEFCPFSRARKTHKFVKGFPFCKESYRHFGCLFVNGKRRKYILFCGGELDGKLTNKMFKYDLYNNCWEMVPHQYWLPQPVQNPCLVLTGQNDTKDENQMSIHILGGSSGFKKPSDLHCVYPEFLLGMIQSHK